MSARMVLTMVLISAAVGLFEIIAIGYWLNTYGGGL